VLHPATHDEAVVKLPLYRDVFTGAGGLAYWSDPERRLTERLFPVAGKPELVVGLGVEPGTGDSAMARAALGLDDRPFVLCLGRVDDGKGVRVLAECFAAYKARRPGPLALLFAGPVVHAPPAHPDIVVAGVVAESVKWGLLRGTVALISPSAFESFSIVLMEAWVVGTPALVNDRCAVTREHALRSGGGLTFADYAEFEVALDRVSDGTGFGAALGEAGRRHVERHFRWPEVLDRYDAFLRRAATRHT
jgi:glycosyltransferase involved in cell wall biosynthesis